MPKIKLFFFLFLSLLFLLTIFAYLKIDNIKFEQKLSAYIAWFNPTNDNLNYYNELTRSENFLKIANAESVEFQNDREVFDFLRKNQKPPINLQLPALLKESREIKSPIEFGKEEGIDTNLPKNLSYIIPGKLGYNIHTYDAILFSPENGILGSKYLNYQNSKVDPVPQKTLKGSKDIEQAKTEAKSMLLNLIEILKKPSEIDSKQISLDVESIEKLKNQEVLENIRVNNINFQEKAFTEEDYSKDILNIGIINLTLENCYKDTSIPISFSIKNEELVISDVNSFVKSLCKKQFVKENGILVGVCQDCTFYPADKNHAIRSDYVPTLIDTDIAPGGQVISTQAYPDFISMYKAALNDGISIFVTSGFRSYQTQVETFNSWVQTEINAGYSLEQARIIANTYSALPGFSEHQLGTAMDLNGTGCGISDGYCSSNESVWNWLANNAYKYGFIQSYPEGKQGETGYTTEAWHYRWIGKDLAKKYIEQDGGSKITLNKFLLELGNY